jgi:predicted HicB family RNase H-like nuclease
MTPSQEPQPRQRHFSVRYQARLDAETQATLEDLVKTLHRKRGQVLRPVMQWGLSHSAGWTIDQSMPASPRLVPMLLEPALHQQVQGAAAAHGVSVAAWLRHAMHEVSDEDFPASWRAEETAPRSHESGHLARKFMMRLDQETSTKLEVLTQTFHRSAAEVIRQLIAQATPEDFPQNWQLQMEERRQPEAGQADRITP